MFKKTLLAAAVALAPFGAAQAATLDAVSLLQQFGLITTGNVTVSALKVHGRALIGGSLSGNMAEVNNGNIDAKVASDFDELVLGSATSGTKVRVNNNGSASYNGTPSELYANVKSTPAIAPENYAAILDAFAADLGAMTATASATKVGGNGLSFNASSTGGVTVYDMTAADFQNRDISLALNGADLVVINVSGTGTFNVLSNFNFDATLAKNVIWNLSGFSSVNLQRSIKGQVLAGGMAVSFNSDIEGTLYAGTVQAGAQLHIQTLDYEVPPPVSQVPVPATLPLLLAGAGAFAVLRRRRRA